MWRKQFKDSFVRIAKRLNLLTNRQAQEAQELLSSNPEDSSIDLMVDAGFLSESQADIVAHKMEEEDPEAHLAETFKKARQVQQDVTETTLNASQIHAALAAKKKG